MKTKLTKIAQLVGIFAVTLASMNAPAFAGAEGVMRIPIKGLKATPVPYPVLSPAAIDFGSVTVNTAASAQTATLTNSGNAPLSITGTSSLSAPFSLSANSCGASLNPGATCTFQFGYTPTTASPGSTTFSVTTNAGVLSLPISGAGVQGIPGTSPGSVSFGGVQVGSSATAQTLTLSNSGNGPFTITATPSTTAPFALSNNTCSGTLASGASCTMQVGFTPTTIGSYSLPLTIPTSVGSLSVNLSGTGLGASPGVSPTSLSFGNVAVGSTSSAQTVNFTNSGNEALTITSAPAVAAPFQIGSNTCSGSIAGGASCSFQVAYAPTSATSSSTSVSIGTSAGSTSVTVSGTGTQGSPSVSTSSLSFGSVNVGSTSSAQTVTLSNTGNGSLTVGTISASSPFKISSNACGSTLAANGSCAIQVEYVPTAAGASSGSLSIPTNISTKTVSLSGTGIAATPGASVSPPSIAVNDEEDIGALDTLPGITVQSTGTGPLTINSIGLTFSDPNQSLVQDSAYLTGCSNGQVIPSGQSCVVYINVNVGNDLNQTSYSGTVTINTNAGTYTIPYSGYAQE